MPYGNETKGVEPLSDDAPFQERFGRRPWLMGANAGAITEVQPAKQIVEEMVGDAVTMLSAANGFILNQARL